jgi:hypothetical protein
MIGNRWLRVGDRRAFFIIFVKYACQFLGYSMPCSILYGSFIDAMCTSVATQESVEVASRLIFLSVSSRNLGRLVLFSHRLVSPISGLYIQCRGDLFPNRYSGMDGVLLNWH